MNKILVPTDFSEQSFFAFELAVSVAGRSGASIHLYHVIEVPDYPEITDISAYALLGTTNVLQKVEERMQEIADSDLCSSLRMTWSVDYDTPYEKIITKSAAEAFDLIIIGSHGRRASDIAGTGSTTAKIIRNAARPVLVTGEQRSCFSPSDIIFSSDFHGPLSLEFASIREFLSLYSATLHLVKVNTRHHFETTTLSRRNMESFAASAGLASYSVNIYNDDTEEEGIANFAREKEASLICMPTRTWPGFARFIRGSVAEHVIGLSACPVLVYPVSGN